MERLWEEIMNNHPFLATLIIFGGLAFAFWFLMIFDFPERLFRKFNRKDNNKDSGHDSGYNIFD